MDLSGVDKAIIFYNDPGKPYDAFKLLDLLIKILKEETDYEEDKRKSFVTPLFMTIIAREDKCL